MKWTLHYHHTRWGICLASYLDIKQWRQMSEFMENAVTYNSNLGKNKYDTYTLPRIRRTCALGAHFNIKILFCKLMNPHSVDKMISTILPALWEDCISSTFGFPIPVRQHLVYYDNTSQELCKWFLLVMLVVVRCQLYLTHLPLLPHILVSESDQHWFRWWLIAYSAPSHYLNQC